MYWTVESRNTGVKSYLFVGFKLKIKYARALLKYIIHTEFQVNSTHIQNVFFNFKVDSTWLWSPFVMTINM